MKVEESLNVTFDEFLPPPKTSPLEDDELVEEEAIEVSKTKPIGNDLEDNEIVNIKESKTHPLENIIEANGFCHLHNGSGIRKRRKGMSTSSMDENNLSSSMAFRKKPNLCNTSNVLNTTSPIPKPLTPHHEPSQENNHPNQALPNPYIKDTPTSPQVVSHPPLPISPINSHIAHTQAPPQSNNQTQHTPPLSPSRESLVDDINQLQDLSNLLAMHLTQQQNNIPSSPYSPNLPHTLNINQVETHVGYCPCCIFTQKQFLALSEDINWIEFLLTRPHPPPRVQRDYPSTTASAPNSPTN
ncbi:hypothetical protein Tco_0928592 [Tanacetum coccineum]